MFGISKKLQFKRELIHLLNRLIETGGAGTNIGSADRVVGACYGMAGIERRFIKNAIANLR